MAAFLNAIDLVTQNQVTVVARVGINPSDRLLGDIKPSEATVFVNFASTSSRRIALDSKALSFEINSTAPLSKNSNFGGNKSLSISGDYSKTFNAVTTSGYAAFNGAIALNFGSIAVTATNFRSQLFSTAGSTTWTVPSGVTSISVAAVGGGGGGAQNISGGSGGSGGALSFVNSIPVTPGNVYTVIVGSGGATGDTYGQSGYDTSMLAPSGTIPIVLASGGPGGDSLYWTNTSKSIFAYDYYGTNLIDTQSAYDPQSRDIQYSVSSGTLPTGAYLNTWTGQVYWTRQGITAITEYSSVTLSAAVSGQTITKSYIITISNKIPILIDYMIVGGGGSGGFGYTPGGGSGGGGAGGLHTATSVTIIAGTTATITIGAGGASVTADGNISSIECASLGLLAIAGYGGGGGYVMSTGAGGGNNGTSGGGGSAGQSSSGSGGNSTAAGSSLAGPWGNSGGIGVTAASAYWSGGGGGGWGLPGYSGSAGSGGAGGRGSSSTVFIISPTDASSISFGQYVSAVNGTYVCGGGGGGVSSTGSPAAGAGGSGGGGAAGANGLANTGGGGGGATTPSFAFGQGGSGTVLIRTVSSYSLATLTGSVTASVASGYRYYKFTGSGTIAF